MNPPKRSRVDQSAAVLIRVQTITWFSYWLCLLYMYHENPIQFLVFWFWLLILSHCSPRVPHEISDYVASSVPKCLFFFFFFWCIVPKYVYTKFLKVSIYTKLQAQTFCRFQEVKKHFGWYSHACSSHPTLLETVCCCSILMQCWKYVLQNYSIDLLLLKLL